MPLKIRLMTIAIAVIAGLVAASIVYLAWGAAAAWRARSSKPADEETETDDEQTPDEPE